MDDIDLLFRLLADRVAAHAAIEERVFDKAVRARQIDDTLVDARHEHGAIKRVLDSRARGGLS